MLYRGLWCLIFFSYSFFTVNRSLKKLLKHVSKIQILAAEFLHSQKKKKGHYPK